MRQNLWECYNSDEWPYEVWYYTPKQKSKKGRYFRSLEEVKAWLARHKTARIEAASWQVFCLRNGMK
ncbi:MAG: hypothetical protein J6Q14_08105 [Oscillospiraceae bacterium]|nr:hypothetical protein [Oscillospiraceae bacterium]